MTDRDALVRLTEPVTDDRLTLLMADEIRLRLTAAGISARVDPEDASHLNIGSGPSHRVLVAPADAGRARVVASGYHPRPMADDTAPEGWTAVTDALAAAQLEQALALLAENDIEARAAAGRIEVPAALESDAVAIVAGVLGEGDAPPDPMEEAALLARCTHRINDEGMSGFDAQAVVNHLRSVGIAATTGDASTIVASDAAMVADFHVFVDPADADRVQDVLAQIRKVAAQEQPSLLPSEQPPDAASGADAEPPQEMSPLASLIFLAGLGLIALVVMKSCA